MAANQREHASERCLTRDDFHNVEQFHSAAESTSTSGDQFDSSGYGEQFHSASSSTSGKQFDFSGFGPSGPCVVACESGTRVSSVDPSVVISGSIINIDRGQPEVAAVPVVGEGGRLGRLGAVAVKERASERRGKQQFTHTCVCFEAEASRPEKQVCILLTLFQQLD